MTSLFSLRNFTLFYILLLSFIYLKKSFFESNFHPWFSKDLKLIKQNKTYHTIFKISNSRIDYLKISSTHSLCKTFGKSDNSCYLNNTKQSLKYQPKNTYLKKTQEALNCQPVYLILCRLTIKLLIMVKILFLYSVVISPRYIRKE